MPDPVTIDIEIGMRAKIDRDRSPELEARLRRLADSLLSMNLQILDESHWQDAIGHLESIEQLFRRARACSRAGGEDSL